MIAMDGQHAPIPQLLRQHANAVLASGILCQWGCRIDRVSTVGTS